MKFIVLKVLAPVVFLSLVACGGSGEESVPEPVVTPDPTPDPVADPVVDLLVQAEDYTAFSDSDTGNTGGVYRDDDVDIEASNDEGGGFHVGWRMVGV
jgi:hypothetical protein